MSSPFDPSTLWSRIRRALGFSERQGGPSAHRTSRRERDEQYTRMLIGGLAIVGVIAVLALGGGIFYDNIVKPNTVLASVDGEDISRRDYWKYATVMMYQQADEYEEFADQVEGQQRSQFLSFASSLRGQAGDVWGTEDVSDSTLIAMIQDRIYLQAAEEMDLDLSEEAVRAFVQQEFAPEGAVLTTPYPQPTLTPARAAWATQTVVAQAALEAEMSGTPGATPVIPSPQATPVGGATPNPEDVAEADAMYGAFSDDVFETARISEQEYLDIVARPLLARQLVTAAVGAEVPQEAEQVHARHILVSTEDLANELYERANGGADFAELARNNSTDQATSVTGGDLGWFTRGSMVPPFEEAAFNLEPGSISEPVQTDFGWHIILVEDRDDARALTELQYQDLRQQAVEDRIAETRETVDVDADVDIAPTPTPEAEQFIPPADAPTPVAATPVPVAAATPVGSPAATPVVIGPVLEPEVDQSEATPEN